MQPPTAVQANPLTDPTFFAVVSLSSSLNLGFPKKSAKFFSVTVKVLNSFVKKRTANLFAILANCLCSSLTPASCVYPSIIDSIVLSEIFKFNFS